MREKDLATVGLLCCNEKDALKKAKKECKAFFFARIFFLWEKRSCERRRENELVFKEKLAKPYLNAEPFLTFTSLAASSGVRERGQFMCVLRCNVERKKK